jgi:hypothetical protein
MRIGPLPDAPPPSEYADFIRGVLQVVEMLLTLGVVLMHSAGS